MEERETERKKEVGVRGGRKEMREKRGRDRERKESSELDLV